MASATGAAIRAELEQAILSGAWPPGSRIPTEHQLMHRHGCARMTVHRVLVSLAERGLIIRRRRAGSFVATPPAAERAVLTIADFGDEAARLGQSYRHDILDQTTRAAQPDPGFTAGEPLLAITCRHLFDDVPVASEDRLIRLGCVPTALQADFQAEPPGRWLLRHVPWSRATHDITAAAADQTLADRLHILPGSVLLRLHRRTWLAGALVTDVRFNFPGGRYRLTGSFAPGD